MEQNKVHFAANNVFQNTWNSDDDVTYYFSPKHIFLTVGTFWTHTEKGCRVSILNGLR